MTDPETDPAQYYRLTPTHMEEGIRVFLSPVVGRLTALGAGFAESRDAIKAAHDNQTPGWFGGEGSGEVKPATSSFLNEVTYQLDQLVADQNSLTESLTQYREFLLGHIDWARETEVKHTERFTAIARDLDGRW